MTTDDPSCRNCVPDKTENININVFNMITRINESKTLIKHMSCECKCKFDCSKYNSSLKWNKNRRQYECKSLKKHHVCKNIKLYGILVNIIAKMVNIWKVLWVIQ